LKELVQLRGRTLNTPEEKEKGIEKEPRRRSRGILAVLLTGMMAIGSLMALIVPRMVREAVASGTVETFIVFNSLFFAMLWRYKFRKGWHGLIIGCILGLLITMAVDLIFV
jgi:hypothetical protein